MGWLDRWLGKWGSRWLGYETEQAPPQYQQSPYTRYGRIWKPSKDRLFSFQEGDLACEISPGAVALQRQPTDDYVRFRVPDTNCPQLPRPDTPLDDGAADNAEPGRWSFGGKTDYYGPGWQFGPNWDDALNYVSPTYSCYDGDFLTCIKVGAGATASRQDPIYYVADYFRFVVQNAGGVGIGFGGFLRAVGGGAFVVDIVAITPSGYVSYNVGVGLGEPFYLFIRRSAGTISVGWSVDDPDAPDPNTEVDVAHGVTGWVHLALGKDFYLPPSDPPLPPPARVVANVLEWRTIYGGPSEIRVLTPVVDVGQPLRVRPKVLPGGALEWRASNQPFAPGDSNPPWNNPQGEYRYWQARVTSTSKNTLIERIELIPDLLFLEPVWLRNRLIWLARTNQNPVVVPFRPVAWSHKVSSMRKTAGGYEVEFLDSAEEYSLLLEEV